MFKNKFVFWAGIIAILFGAIVGFQNQVPLKNNPVEKKSTLDYIIPVLTNNPIVKSIESIGFENNTKTQIPQDVINPLPPRTEISALAYGTYFIGSDSTTKNLIGQNLDSPLRIASITKLMTALVTMDSLNLNKIIEVTNNDIGKDSYGRYKVGDKLTLQNILYSLLIESDNDAARIISDNYGNDRFILAMNEKARTLGMINTRYSNSSGVDEDVSANDNVSTVSDLSKLEKYI